MNASLEEILADVAAAIREGNAPPPKYSDEYIDAVLQTLGTWKQRVEQLEHALRVLEPQASIDILQMNGNEFSSGYDGQMYYRFPDAIHGEFITLGGGFLTHHETGSAIRGTGRGPEGLLRALEEHQRAVAGAVAYVKAGMAMFPPARAATVQDANGTEHELGC